MPRYQNKVYTTKLPDQIISEVTPFFHENGFFQKEYKGEVLWQKGEGLATAPQFIKLYFNEGYVVVEAWIKFAWFPGVYGKKDMDLEGAMGFAIKKVLKGKVKKLERIIEAPYTANV